MTRMFEFGRELRRLFAQARDSDDLGWTELIGVDLLALEARQQATDAGRVSCDRPAAAYRRAAALWREHARRTGAPDSLARARVAAEDAARQARTADDRARAAVAAAETALLTHDLTGDPDALTVAAVAIDLTQARGQAIQAAAASIHARVHARHARRQGRTEALMDAGALIDAAIHALEQAHSPDVADLRLERAALMVEGGVARRDAAMLDQAGRELKALVEAASPEHRPLTRARALTLCGVGLRLLGALADDAAARAQGAALFDAAADQFTPDHSPLDWATVQIIRAGFETSPLSDLRLAARLTDGAGLTLGALARDQLLEAEIAVARGAGAETMLAGLEADIRRRLMSGRDALPADWAADQIGLARIAVARSILSGADAGRSGLALLEAAEAARAHGAPALADRAQRLLAEVRIRA